GLANTVVHVLLEAAFPPRVLSETAFGVLRAYLLQPLAARVIALARVLYLLATECLALTIRGEIHDTHVNTQHATIWLLLRRILRFPALGDMQIIHPTPPDQISAADFPCRVYQHRMLTSAQDQAANHAPVQRVERDAIKAHQAIGAGVVAHAATRPKTRACLTMRGLDRLDGFNCFRSGTDRQLRTKSEVEAGLTVHPMVGSVRVVDALIPTHPRNPGSRIIEGVLRRRQSRLRAVNVQLDTACATEC